MARDIEAELKVLHDRRQDFLKQGRCGTCGDPVARYGRRSQAQSCESCLDKQAASQRRLRRERRAEGKCIRCDRLRFPRNRNYCAKHRAEQQASEKRCRQRKNRDRRGQCRSK